MKNESNSSLVKERIVFAILVFTLLTKAGKFLLFVYDLFNMALNYKGRNKDIDVKLA